MTAVFLKLDVVDECDVATTWHKSILWLGENVGTIKSLHHGLSASGYGWRLDHHISFSGAHSLYIHIDDPTLFTLATLVLFPTI